jgi:hypothetical protein
MTRDISLESNANKPVERTEAAAVEAANTALANIGRTAETWLDIVAPIYMAGRHAAMAEARTNQPKGKAYNRCLHAWATRVHFDLKLINEKTRTALARLTEHRVQFDTWWSTRTTSQRQEWSHPPTLLRHFDHYRIKTSPGGSLAAEKMPAAPTAKQRIAVLTIENNMLKAKLAEDGDGALLIDFDRDNDTDMTRVVLQEPAVLRNPRRFAALFHRWAYKLEEQAHKRQSSDEARAGVP